MLSTNSFLSADEILIPSGASMMRGVWLPSFFFLYSPSAQGDKLTRVDGLKMELCCEGGRGKRGLDTWQVKALLLLP